MGDQISTFILLPQILKKCDSSKRKVNLFASSKIQSINEKHQNMLFHFLVSFCSSI